MRIDQRAGRCAMIRSSRLTTTRYATGPDPNTRSGIARSRVAPTASRIPESGRPPESGLGTVHPVSDSEAFPNLSARRAVSCDPLRSRFRYLIDADDADKDAERHPGLVADIASQIALNGLLAHLQATIGTRRNPEELRGSLHGPLTAAAPLAQGRGSPHAGLYAVHMCVTLSRNLEYCQAQVSFGFSQRYPRLRTIVLRASGAHNRRPR